MSIASLRKIIRSARKGLCSTCSKTEYPQLEAAGAGHVGCLMYTVETQGLSSRDSNNVSAVHVAARKGQLEVLIFLVENGLVNDIFRAKNGATPGHDAAGTGNIECLRYLLVHTGCSAHDKDYSGQTPLHWAAMFGQLRAVIWLVTECNATINVENSQGLSAVHLAAQKSRLDVVQWLVKYTYKTHSNPRDVVNQRSKQGATPLFLASTEGNIQVVRWLAEKAGGDPTIFSYTGVAPLHAAVAMGHQEAVQYLFQFGVGTAPGGLRTRDGSTTLHMAARCGHAEIVRWLISQKQVTGNETDHTQYTAAHEAAEQGHVKILKFLFDHGINVDAPDINGNTPLDIAIRMRRKACENFLQAATLARPNGMRRPVVRRGSTNNSHLDNYGSDPFDDMATQLSVDMDEAIVHEATADSGMFPTLRDMMGQEEMQKFSSSKSNQEGDLQEMKKMQEEERKRKALTAKLQEEQRRKQQFVAKKKEKEREEEAAIRVRLLNENSPEAKETEEVENYISRSATLESEGQRRRSIVEERKSAFELSTTTVEEKAPTKKPKGFLQRLKKSVSAPGSLLKSASKEPPPEHHVLKVDTSTAVPQPTKTSSLKTPTQLPKTSATSTSNSILEASPGGHMDDEGSVTSLVSSRSGGSSSKAGKKLRRRQRLEGKTPWGETGEALRAGMSWTYSELHQTSSSPAPGRRRRPKVRKLTPAPQPIKARLAEKGQFPKLNLDEAPNSKALATKGISPKQLANAVNDSFTKASSKPKFMRQHGQGNEAHTPSPPPSPTLAGIEDELSRMEDTALALQNPSQVPSLLRRFGQASESPELTDSEEEYTDSEESESSSGDSDSTESSDSSDRKRLRLPTPATVASLRAGLARGGLLGPRAIGGRSGSPRKALAGQFVRLRRRTIRLPTIPEEPDKEAKALEAESMGPEEQALAVYRLRLQWKVLRSWKYYTVFMAASRQRAEAMAEEKKRELMMKVFEAWLHLTHQALVDSIGQVAEETPVKTPPSSRLFQQSTPRTNVPDFMQQWPAKTIAPIPPKEAPTTRASRKEERGNLPTSPLSPKTDQPSAHLRSPAKEDLVATADTSQELPSPSGGDVKKYQRRMSLVKMSNADKSQVYLEWLNDQLEEINLPKVDDISDSIANGVVVLKVLVNLSGRKMPHIHPNPKFFPQFMNNWKLVRDEMQALGMKTMGIEPEDLSKKDEAVIHLMFNIILKYWNAKYPV